jgi:hypothetical protein
MARETKVMESPPSLSSVLDDETENQEELVVLKELYKVTLHHSTRFPTDVGRQNSALPTECWSAKFLSNSWSEEPVHND